MRENVHDFISLNISWREHYKPVPPKKKKQSVLVYNTLPDLFQSPFSPKLFPASCFIFVRC